MKKLALHWQILIGMALGVVFALLGGEAVGYIDWIGTLFLRLLRMIIVPLIVASIVSGVAGQASAAGLGKLGVKTLFYYLSTSLLAIVVGLFLVNLIQPGVGAELRLEETPEGLQTATSVSDSTASPPNTSPGGRSSTAVRSGLRPR